MQLTRSRLVPIVLSAFLALPALLAAQEPVTITGKVTSDAGQPLGQVEVAIPTARTMVAIPSSCRARGSRVRP